MTVWTSAAVLSETPSLVLTQDADRISLIISLDARSGRIRDFQAGTVFLQLIPQPRRMLMRLRITGLCDWLELEPLLKPALHAATEFVPVELILRDATTGRCRATRGVFISSRWVVALSQIPDSSAIPMVEVALSKPPSPMS